MKKKQIGGLVIAAVLFIIIGVISVLTHTVSEKILAEEMIETLAGGTEFDPPLTDYIAVVDVVGTIQEQTATGPFDTPEGYQHTTTLDYIDNLMGDVNNVGILLYVDSPGGTVYESEELYDKLREYSAATERPVWAYMAHYAASGGYMTSVAADKIYANKNTITGSIGVIMSGYDLSGLYEKLGIRYVSITSGVNKDSSQMTEEQIEIYQSQVDESYDSFVEKVAVNRKMREDEVRTLADGRTYTAAQALENGLIDEISSFEDMQYAMMEELGTDEFYQLSQDPGIFAALFAKIEESTPKSEAQILTETAEKMESGVLMYYAEQLQ